LEETTAELIMLRRIVRRAAPMRTIATARASPRCLASIDASADATRLRRGGRGFATVDEATAKKKKLDLSSHQLFGALGLQTFSKDELRKAFDKADLDGDGVINCREAGKIFADSVSCEDRPAAAAAVLEHLDRDHDGNITWAEFEKSILEEASTVDTTVYPLAAVMFSGGLSVGTIMPVLPIIVRDLGLGPAEYGLAVSAFGATKLIGNVPAASLVETAGRRPIMVGGLLLVGGGFAAIALADGTAGLAAARALTGVGVAGLMTAIQMTSSDISTPLTRASTAVHKKKLSRSATCS
jgi:hypothetical protein